jgi:hypothetical protein
MATSKFEKRFTNNSGSPLLGATIEIIPQANVYPTGKLALTEHPTRRGWYYRNAVPLNEYKIYVNGVLYTEYIFHPEMLLSYIAALFDIDLKYIGEIKNTTDCGTAAFLSFAETHSVAISGASANDKYIVTPIGDSYDVNDSLKVRATGTGFTVTRSAGGTEHLQFNWFRRKYGTF